MTSPAPATVPAIQWIGSEAENFNPTDQTLLSTSTNAAHFRTLTCRSGVSGTFPTINLPSGMTGPFTLYVCASLTMTDSSPTGWLNERLITWTENGVDRACMRASTNTLPFQAEFAWCRDDGTIQNISWSGSGLDLTFTPVDGRYRLMLYIDWEPRTWPGGSFFGYGITGFTIVRDKGPSGTLPGGYLRSVGSGRPNQNGVMTSTQIDGFRLGSLKNAVWSEVICSIEEDWTGLSPWEWYLISLPPTAHRAFNQYDAADPNVYWSGSVADISENPANTATYIETPHYVGKGFELANLPQANTVTGSLTPQQWQVKAVQTQAMAMATAADSAYSPNFTVGSMSLIYPPGGGYLDQDLMVTASAVQYTGYSTLEPTNPFLGGPWTEEAVNLYGVWVQTWRETP